MEGIPPNLWPLHEGNDEKPRDILGVPHLWKPTGPIFRVQKT
jgi:hypothetical protein